ncbi:MAG: septum formation protein Maf, partial [Candidatus Levybacteria bacterium]|nr:septum formation protein Maf [Candidatus Levybacteria bacterium]
LAKRLALGKARNIASKVQNAIIIGADSFAVLEGKIMGKPHTKERAIEYLSRLNGKTHEFYTGMAVIDTERQREVADCTTARVRFKTLSQNEIEQYVRVEDAVTAGGAYRIQGLGAVLIEKVEGDYYAVVGLSPSVLQEMLKSLGHSLFDYIE